MNVPEFVEILKPWYLSLLILSFSVFIPIFFQCFIYEDLKNGIKNTFSEYTEFLFPTIEDPLRYFLYTLIVKFAVINSPVYGSEGIGNVYKFLNCILLSCVTWAVYGFMTPKVIDGVRDGVVFRLLKNCVMKRGGEADNSSANAMAEMMSVLLRLSILAIGFGFITSELGFNINAFIASLSIGSLAVMYAAKDMLANVFGSLVIIIDQPFKIGDWIKTHDVEGTVVNVTFRSTQIKNMAGEMVYIPSSLLTNAPIINIKKSEERQIQLAYSINGETRIEVLEELADKIKEILDSNESLSHEEDKIGVYFDSDYEDCYIARVEAFVLGYKQMEYLNVRNKVNLAILKLIQNSGIRLIQKPQHLNLPQKTKKSKEELLLVGALAMQEAANQEELYEASEESEDEEVADEYGPDDDARD